MEIAAGMGFEVEERNLTRCDIWSAEECFLTGTAAEIVSVISLDGRVIGTGKPGETTKNIRKEYSLLTHVRRSTCIRINC
jgi:branched-chain amino acid aminotransferase